MLVVRSRNMLVLIVGRRKAVGDSSAAQILHANPIIGSGAALIDPRVIMRKEQQLRPLRLLQLQRLLHRQRARPFRTRPWAMASDLRRPRALHARSMRC